MSGIKFIDGDYNPRRDMTPPAPASAPGTGPELCTREGAERLAQRIMSFWHSQGYTHVWARVGPKVQGDEDGSKAIYSVETNLLPGCLPPPKTIVPQNPEEIFGEFRNEQRW